MKRTMRSVAVATIALTTLGITGCAGNSGGGGGGGELEVLTGIPADTPQYTAMEEAAAEFEAANSDVTVRLVPRSGTFEEDLKVRLASRDVPDVFNTHGWSRDRYSQFLQPLSDQPWASNLSPALEAAMTDDAGEFYALPIDVSVAGLVYNVPALEAAGVDPASITSWETFDTAAAAVKSAGIVPIAASGKDNWTAGNVADWIVPGYFDDTQVAALQDGEFDSAAYAGMLERLAGWSADGFYNPDYTSATFADVTRLIATGEAAFFFQTNAVVPPAQTLNPDLELGFIPVPSEVGSPYLIGGESVAFGASKTGDMQEQAVKFLDFLAQPDVLGPLATSQGNASGLTDATSELGIMQASYDTYVTEAQTPLVPYFDRVYLPGGMWNTMVTTTDSMITGQSTPEDAAAQMATSFETLFSQG